MFISGILFSGCSTMNPTQEKREKRMQNSSQYSDGEFVNPIEAPVMAPGTTWKYIKKRLFTSRIDPEPTGELPVKPVQRNDWTFCQIQYNFLDTQNQAGTAGLQYAASKDMAVIIMEPLRGGNLAKTPLATVKDIWAKADQKKTPAAWSLGWIWNHPEVIVVLSGMNNDDHINENLALAEKALPNSFTEKEIKLVEDAAAEFRRVMKVGCTGCQYCMPCPAGVNIPSCFEFYNSRHTFKDKAAKLMYVFFNGGIVTDEPSLASTCVQCEECLGKCPQHLPIPDLLNDVQEDMEGFFTKPLIWLIKRTMKVRKKQKKPGAVSKR